MQNSIATIDQAKNTLIDVAIRFGPKLLAALLILVVGVVVTRWMTRWLARGLNRLELEPPVRLLLVRVVLGALHGAVPDYGVAESGR